MQEEKFNELIAKAGEHFEDYVVIVRCDQGMMFKSSDSNWSLGAMSRIASEIQDKDRYSFFKSIMGGE